MSVLIIALNYYHEISLLRFSCHSYLLLCHEPRSIMALKTSLFTNYCLVNSRLCLGQFITIPSNNMLTAKIQLGLGLTELFLTKSNSGLQITTQRRKVIGHCKAVCILFYCTRKNDCD